LTPSSEFSTLPLRGKLSVYRLISSSCQKENEGNMPDEREFDEAPAELCSM
jgi:hypothetical protein